MLLQLEDTNYANLKKLLDYAKQLNLRLKLVDEDESNTTLPGKPLSKEELSALIAKSRKTGAISMSTAHDIIRKNFNAD